MKTFENKVAVITGAASGIGRAIAHRCAREGMSVVLADIQEEALPRAEEEIKEIGAAVLPVLTDVSKASDIDALAQKTLDTFGAVHLLFNNAGVGVGRLVPLWETTMSDWQWCMNVNLWSAIYGIRTFVPIMIQQDTECHIVNTSSVAGFLSSTMRATYNVTKNGVIILSETLHLELKEAGKDQIGVSVLCPGFVNTNIVDAETYRPPELKNNPQDEIVSPELQKKKDIRCRAVTLGMDPGDAADHTFKAIRENRFYIFTHPEIKPLIEERTENIVNDRQPEKPAYSRDMYPPELRDQA